MAPDNTVPDPVPAPTDCRILTYNVLYDGVNTESDDWTDRRAWLVDELDRLQPDVIAFQEVWMNQFRNLRSALPAFSFVGTDGDRQHTPIAYRTNQFDLCEWGTFWLSGPETDPGLPGWDGTYQRLVTHATLCDRNHSQELTVYSVHLDNEGTQARQEGIQLVREHVSNTGEAIVAGDFNCLPDSPAHRRATVEQSGLRSLSDVTTEAASVSGPAETYTGFTARDDPRDIDHILVTSGLAVEQVVTCVPRNEDTQPPSDHRPVFADLWY